MASPKPKPRKSPGNTPDWSDLHKAAETGQYPAGTTIQQLSQCWDATNTMSALHVATMSKTLPQSTTVTDLKNCVNCDGISTFYTAAVHNALPRETTLNDLLNTDHPEGTNTFIAAIRGSRIPVDVTVEVLRSIKDTHGKDGLELLTLRIEQQTELPTLLETPPAQVFRQMNDLALRVIHFTSKDPAHYAASAIWLAKCLSPATQTQSKSIETPSL